MRITLALLLALSLAGCEVGHSATDRRTTDEAPPRATEPAPAADPGAVEGAVGGVVEGADDEPQERMGSAPFAPAAAKPGDAPSGPVDAASFRDPSLFPTAAIATYQFLKSHGDHTASLTRIRRILRGDMKGIGFKHVADYLARHRVTSKTEQVTAPALRERGALAIVAMRSAVTSNRPEQGYFAIVRPASEGNEFDLIDPMVGTQRVTVDAFAAKYLGVALTTETAPTFDRAEGPDIHCEELVYGFDDVAMGEEIRHNFRITNRGSKPLKVSQVATTCGCAAAMVNKSEELANHLVEAARKNAAQGAENDKKLKEQAGAGGTLLPGESAYVSAFVNTAQKQGFLSFRVRIKSNDPEEPECVISLQGNVLRVIEVDPVSLWFRDVHSDSGAKRYIWIRHYQGKPLDLTEFASTSKDFTAAVDDDAPRTVAPLPMSRPGALPRRYPKEKGWRAVRVELAKGAAIGPRTAAIRGKANGTPVTVSVAATVKGNLVVEPAYFSFGHVRKGAPLTIQISVSSMAKGLKLDKAVSNRDFMVTDVQAVGDGKYVVKLSLKKGWEALDLQGAVELHTNDPLEPQRKVLVYGFIKRG